MRREQLSDALEFLDEALLEEADALRCSRWGRAWLRRTARAAGLCLALLAAALCVFLLRARQTGQSPPELTQPQTPENQEQQTPLPEGTGSGTEEEVTLRPLAQLQLPQEEAGSMGFAAVLLEDPARYTAGSPISAAEAPETLPAFRNGSYSGAQPPVGLDEAALRERIEDAAAALGVQVLAWQAETWQDRVWRLEGEAGGLSIRAEADGQLTVRFDEGPVLPEDYRFEATPEAGAEAEAAMAYFVGKYASLLNFASPQYVYRGDFTIHGEYLPSYTVYDADSGPEQTLLNYCFRRAELFLSAEGQLTQLVLHDELCCAEPLGDYPLISRQEAETLLRQGSFISSVPYAVTADSEIGAVELVYRTSSADADFLPYYLFYVVLTGEETEISPPSGIREYGLYYVPAVQEEYLTGFTPYDGSFN